jgi:hypothetical protein
MPIVGFPEFVTVRLTKTEKAILKALAAREQTTISAMVRECIVRESVRPLFAGPVEPHGDLSAEA